jgi:hypothetical protein
MLFVGIVVIRVISYLLLAKKYQPYFYFRVDTCSSSVEKMTDTKLDELAQNLELDSMFELLCSNVDKVTKFAFTYVNSFS